MATAAPPAGRWPEPDVEISGESLHSEAQQLLAKRKWDEAAIVFRSVLRKNPGMTEAVLGLAQALALSGRREEALGILWRAVESEKGTRRSVLVRRARALSKLFLTNETFQLYQDGLNLVMARKYGQARERFEKAAAQEPDNVEILVRLGQCLVLASDFDSAAERLRVARRLNPYEPEVKLWLGRSLHQRGEIKEAVEELKAAHAETRSETAAIWLASALFSVGQRAQAIQLLDEDLRAQPFHLSALLTLARFRIVSFARDTAPLWAARKDLQLILSRLASYPVRDPIVVASDLSLEIRSTAAEIREETDKLLRQIEAKLESPGEDV